jgi:hypothetical protein
MAAELDTSRIANEKQRKIAYRLFSMEEKAVNLEASFRDIVSRIEAIEKKVGINIADNRADLEGYEGEEDTIPMLREQLDKLGVKYHNAHKEKKLRELLNEALMGKGEENEIE